MALFISTIMASVLPQGKMTCYDLFDTTCMLPPYPYLTSTLYWMYHTWHQYTNITVSEKSAPISTCILVSNEQDEDNLTVTLTMESEQMSTIINMEPQSGSVSRSNRLTKLMGDLKGSLASFLTWVKGESEKLVVRIVSWKLVVRIVSGYGLHLAFTVGWRLSGSQNVKAR